MEEGTQRRQVALHADMEGGGLVHEGQQEGNLYVVEVVGLWRPLPVPPWVGHSDVLCAVQM